MMGFHEWWLIASEGEKLAAFLLYVMFCWSMSEIGRGK